MTASKGDPHGEKIREAEEQLLLAEGEMLRAAFEACGWRLCAVASYLGLANGTVQGMLSRHPALEKERAERKQQSWGGQPPRPIPTKDELRAALEKDDWIVRRAATALEVSPVTLRKWIRLHGLDEECRNLGPTAMLKRSWQIRRTRAAA